ncbi:MAG: hypothetical protein Q4F83_10965 [Eubacteriales bacterium]|nr:hypothetical protein [Eubacteriales bacterium]
MVEEIMEICHEALKEAGYETYGYSETYQHFTVRTDEEDIVVDFRED